MTLPCSNPWLFVFLGGRGATAPIVGSPIVKFPIIGVGGIVSAADALAMLRAGANLIQIYTGFAYRGQLLIEEILDALACADCR